MPLINRKKTIGKGPQSPEAIAMRRIMREADPQRLDDTTVVLPEEDTGERQHFIFYQDEGGLRATDEANENMDTIYYLGVIDILTPYNFLKKCEHFWKGLSADRVRFPASCWLSGCDVMLTYGLVPVYSIRSARFLLPSTQADSLRL